ncbi:MAG: tRNA (adenosine(37)-N6)-dimethylallyltransferase MiaA [Huintestinicola sp.]
MNRIPLLVICGPTASGKTRVGIELAKEYNGEVISADSMQIYRGMSVLTAKPTAEEMDGIPHHLIDFLEPDCEFSVADYVKLAKEKIEDVHSRGKLPVIVGGTGLYINSVVDNISFDHIAQDPELRKRLEEEAAREGSEYMHRKLAELDPKAAEDIHPNNAVRVIRAIEMCILSGRTGEENRTESRKVQSPYDVCMIGLTCFDREKLYDRINLRVDRMVEDGLLEEVRAVREKYHTRTAFNAIGYKELLPYLDGTQSFDDCIAKIKQESRRYAKRQLTWFRRNPRISWVDTVNYEQFDGIINSCKNIVAKSEIM